MNNSNRTREELNKDSHAYEEALGAQVNEVLQKAKTVLAGAAVVGAGFWIAYEIFKSLSGTKAPTKSKSKQEPPVEQVEETAFSVVKHMILKELAIFLLGIVKEKALEYIQSVAAEEDEDTGSDTGEE